MFFYEGFSCPVCGKAFVDTDDVVACPQCGAPHHRTCWQQVGHCALQDDHGTDRQWSRDTARTVAQPEPPTASPEPVSEGERYAWTCPACGEKNLEYAEFCTKCGRARQSAPEWHSAPPPAQPTQGEYREYTPFTQRPTVDPFGGVGQDEMLDEDVSAKDVVTFTRTNSHYYLPRFRNIANGGMISWNWAAFLLHPYWLLYRKNFLAGFTALLVSVVQGLLTYQVSVRMYDLLGSGLSQTEMAQRASTLLMENETFRYLFVGLMLLTLFDAVIRVLMGLCGTFIYQKTAFSKIKKVKRERPDQLPTALARIGGVSFWSGLLAYLLSDYLVQFFYMLLK